MKLQRVFVFSLLSIGLLFIGCAKEQPQPVQIQESVPEYVQHVVRYSGETLGIIAKWYTGDFNKWSDIVKANPGIKPNRISLGDKIKIPYEVVTNDSPMPKSAVGRVSGSKKSSTNKSSAKAKETKPEMKSEKEAPKVEAPVVSKREIITEPKGDTVAKESVEDEFDAMLEEASKKEQESKQVKEEKADSAEDAGRDKLLEELLSE